MDYNTNHHVNIYCTTWQCGYGIHLIEVMSEYREVCIKTIILTTDMMVVEIILPDFHFLVHVMLQYQLSTYAHIYTQRRWWLFEIYITLVLLIACKWGNKHTLRRRTKSFCWRLLDSNKLQARVRGNCLFLFFNLSTPVVGRACLVL